MKIRTYQKMVAAYCFWLARLAEFTERFKKNGVCEPEELAHLLGQVASYRTQFLDAKIALGLSMGDAFMAPGEVYQFDTGFSLREGRLLGDVTQKQVRKSCQIWMEEFPIDRMPTEAECVRYEVACLCMMLSGSSSRVASRLQKKTLFGRIYDILHIFRKKEVFNQKEVV